MCMGIWSDAVPVRLPGGISGGLSDQGAGSGRAVSSQKAFRIPETCLDRNGRGEQGQGEEDRRHGDRGM